MFRNYKKKAGILILKKKPCFVIQQITSCYTSITVIHQNSFMNMSFSKFYVFMMARLIPLFRELSILCIKAMSASFRHIQNTVSVFLMTVSLLIS